jgi:hypothetical protein
MKLLSKIALAAVLSTALASPAFAGTAGVTGTRSAQPTDPATIAELQRAAAKALQDGRDGNKNNTAFRLKNYQIERLIAEMKAGEPVQQAQIDKALQPVHVW